MVILGADTDARGAIAVLDLERLTLDVYPTPNLYEQTQKGKHLATDFCALAAILIDLTSHADVAFLEKQWGWEGQGISSTFGFGRTFGEYRAATAAGFLLAGRSPTQASENIFFVSGAEWKGRMRLTKDKAEARALASKLFPKCASAWAKVKHTSAAEASLIAFYGASTLKQIIQPGAIIRPRTTPYTQHAKSLIIDK